MDVQSKLTRHTSRRFMSYVLESGLGPLHGFSCLLPYRHNLYQISRAKRIARPTSVIFDGDKDVINDPIFPFETVCKWSQLTAHSWGMPSAFERNTSEGILRIVVVMGAIVTSPRYSSTEFRVRIRTGCDGQALHEKPFLQKQNDLYGVPLKHGRPLQQDHHQASSVWFSFHTSTMWLFIAILIPIVDPVKSICSANDQDAAIAKTAAGSDCWAMALSSARGFRA